MILDISYFFNRQPNPEIVNADRSLFKLVFNQLYLRPFWSEFQPLKGHPLSLIEVIAIAIALAMDAFAVAVAIGVILRRVTTRQTFGIQIGGIVGRRLAIARYAALFGGGVLISIVGKILYEHGAF